MAATSEEGRTMAEATITSVDELRQHVGKETRVGDWHTVTQEEINQFAEATGDHQWIHVDVERANREIAEALFISVRVVEKHINAIFSKLGVGEEADLHRRVKAVLIYLSDGTGAR